ERRSPTRHVHRCGERAGPEAGAPFIYSPFTHAALIRDKVRRRATNRVTNCTSPPTVLGKHMETKRVLVVEDDSAIRQGIVDALQFAGYEVLQSGRGTEALALA